MPHSYEQRAGRLQTVPGPSVASLRRQLERLRPDSSGEQPLGHAVVIEDGHILHKRCATKAVNAAKCCLATPIAQVKNRPFIADVQGVALFRSRVSLRGRGSASRWARNTVSGKAPAEALSRFACATIRTALEARGAIGSGRAGDVRLDSDGVPAARRLPGLRS